MYISEDDSKIKLILFNETRPAAILRNPKFMHIPLCKADEFRKNLKILFNNYEAKTIKKRLPNW